MNPAGIVLLVTVLLVGSIAIFGGDVPGPLLVFGLLVALLLSAKRMARPPTSSNNH